MGEVLIVLGMFILVIALALFILSVRYTAEDKELVTDILRYGLTPAIEGAYDARPITSKNVSEVVDWQIMKAEGIVDRDHPAIAARKAEYTVLKSTLK